jgi:hypothetical protein
MNRFSAVTTAHCVGCCAVFVLSIRALVTPENVLRRRNRCHRAQSPLHGVSLRTACNRATYFGRA